MLADLAEGTAVNRSQTLLNILDDRCLFVERATSNDESFGPAELFYYICKLLAGSWMKPLSPCAMR
jgi:hypothetical protein